MNRFTDMATGLSRVLDKIAGYFMVAIMALNVANILLRSIFNRPILGTIDYVVIMSAVMISLAVPHCAVQNGHVAVTLITERLSIKMQLVLGIVTDVLSFFFWGLCAWQIAVLAQKMAAAGQVAQTSQLPLYPFIYLVGFGLLALCLIILVGMMESYQKAFGEKTGQQNYMGG